MGIVCGFVPYRQLELLAVEGLVPWGDGHRSVLCMYMNCVCVWVSVWVCVCVGVCVCVYVCVGVCDCVCV